MIERMVLRSPIEKIRITDIESLVAVAVHGLGFYQSLGLIVRKRPQHYSVDYTEHRRIGADSQGQRNHCNCRKTWVLPQLPERIKKILHHVCKHVSFLHYS